MQLVDHHIDAACTADRMADKKYGSVIVVGRGGVEGIFTTVDACRAFAEVLRRSVTESIGLPQLQ